MTGRIANNAALIKANKNPIPIGERSFNLVEFCFKGLLLSLVALVALVSLARGKG